MRFDGKKTAPSGLGDARRAAGFTLIELIAVMGIILAMSLLIVGSYSAITRAVAARAGVNHVRNAVILTRQHACTDGQRTYFYVLNNTEYVICRRLGRVTDETKGVDRFGDEFSDFSSYVGNNSLTNQVLFDFSSDQRRPFATVRKLEWDSNAKEHIIYLSQTEGGAGLSTVFNKKAGAYGMAVYVMRELPRGYRFITNTGVQHLYFNPDGTSDGGEIVFEETTTKIKKKVKVAVTGGITVDEGL
jgi:type II secretory pathway pseudopilin PulG